LYWLDTVVAGNFKEQGNEYFKGQRYREALRFYQQAIDAKPDDPALLESLYLNRAACNLELGASDKRCSKRSVHMLIRKG
jgi:tetratricopeptide (TPR) repeat protein